MSFVPVFSITRIPADAKSVYVKDQTPTGGTTGYGSINAPASLAAVTSIFIQLIPYGKTPIQGSLIAGGGLATELGATINIPDGVVTIVVNYGLQLTLATTIGLDRMSMVATGASSLLANVTYISLDGVSFTEIKTIIGNTILFKTALPGSLTSVTSFYKYYSAEQVALILFSADRKIVRQIDKVTQYDENARKAVLLLLLKERSQSEYALGNLAKANESALLISGTQSVYQSNCSTCE